MTPQIRRFTRAAQPWRLHLSLHAATQETRDLPMPAARLHPLPELLAAMVEYQRVSRRRWVTIQYVAIPGMNIDEAHVVALGRELRGLRYILNVIRYNDIGGAFLAPSWAEVKAFTTRLRGLRCPVEIRYSGGKREGLGCGQLAGERRSRVASGGHVEAAPGVFAS